MSFLKKISFCIVVVFAVFACTRDDNRIPNVHVDIAINTFDPTYQNLNGVGGWAYANGGSQGIIVFCAAFEEYVAYDRHSTYQPERNCAVHIDENNLFAVDSCSGSTFQLIDGQVVEGPATLGLKRYNTSFDGNIIQIWN